VKELFRQLFQTGIYKRSQGRITRQVTFFAAAGVWTLGMFRVYQLLALMMDLAPALGIPLLLFVVGVWVCFRVVNVPAFADFLIAVEAEMNKVSWPSRTELVRASLVVLTTILFLTVILTVFDVVWSTVFKFLKVV